MRRTGGESIALDRFDGVNELIDTVNLPTDPNLIASSMGGFYNDGKHFERLPGKVLNSTASTAGSVFSIQEMDFVDRRVVCVHSSTVYHIESVTTNLVASNSTYSVLETIIEL